MERCIMVETDEGVHQGLESLSLIRTCLTAGKIDDCFLTFCKNEDTLRELFDLTAESTLTSISQEAMLAKVIESVDTLLIKGMEAFVGNDAMVSTEGWFKSKVSKEDEEDPLETDKEELFKIEYFNKLIAGLDSKKLDKLTVDGIWDAGDWVKLFKGMETMLDFLSTCSDTDKPKLNAAKGEYWNYMVKTLVSKLGNLRLRIDVAPDKSVQLLGPSKVNLREAGWLDSNNAKTILDIQDHLFADKYHQLGDRIKKYFDENRELWDKRESFEKMSSKEQQIYARRHDLVDAWNNMQHWRHLYIDAGIRTYLKVLRVLKQAQ